MEYTVGRKLCDTRWFSVHAAIRNRDHLPVAIKLLKQGASAEVKMRFAREARILDRLDHPNIVR